MFVHNRKCETELRPNKRETGAPSAHVFNRPRSRPSRRLLHTSYNREITSSPTKNKTNCFVIVLLLDGWLTVCDCFVLSAGSCMCLTDPFSTTDRINKSSYNILIALFPELQPFLTNNKARLHFRGSF